MVQKCSGRLFSCSTICVTSKHAIKKAIIRFGKNSLLSTSFMRLNCNKGHCEVLSEVALIGCPLLTGVSLRFWASMRDNFFYFCNPLWDNPLWCASFMRMSFIENPINFASAKLFVGGILSALLDLQNCISLQESLWLHWWIVQETLSQLV